MKGIIPFIALFATHIAVASMEDDPGCPPPPSFPPDVEERIVEAISLGKTVIYCPDESCYDFSTGEEYFYHGTPNRNTIYFVDMEKTNER